MGAFNERYVVDVAGKRLAVMLEIDEFKRILEELEELESIRAYDAAKSDQDESIPFGDALREIEDGRR